MAHVTRTVTIFVVLGLVAMVLLGLGLGFDVGAVVILTFAGGLGMLAIAAAKKATAGSVAPRQCPSCDGLLSPNAPICKHCLKPL